MANHLSAKKRIRQTEKRRVQNKYYAKTTRNAVKELRAETNKEKANEMLPKVSGLLDRLSMNNVIHKNKAANLKSKLAMHVSSL